MNNGEDQKLANIGIPWDRVLLWVEDWPRTPYKDYVESIVVRFGIPDEWRGAFWQKMSQSEKIKVKNAGLYQKLLNVPSMNQKNIEADVRRSFPNDAIRDAVDTPLKLSALYNVLHAYSNLDKLVSYCQGMNYVVAVLLMFMNEEDAFWVLVNIMFHYGLAGLYRDDVPMLAEYVSMFDTLSKIHQPALISHFNSQGFIPNMYVTEWFTTLFVYRLPLNTILRVWDFFFTYGQAAMFKVGLALLGNCEDLIGLAMEQLAEGLKFKLANIQPQQIIPRAYAIQIPKEYIDKLVDDGLRKKLKTKLKIDNHNDNSCNIM